MDICQCCSKSYSKKKVNQLFCSLKCRRRIENLRSKDRVCVECGDTIVGRHRRNRCAKCRINPYVKVTMPKIRTKPVATKTITLKIKENRE